MKVLLSKLSLEMVTDPKDSCRPAGLVSSVRLVQIGYFGFRLVRIGQNLAEVNRKEIWFGFRLVRFQKNSTEIFGFWLNFRFKLNKI